MKLWPRSRAPGKRLQADVRGCAVTAVSKEGHIRLIDYLLAVHRFIGRFDTAHNGGRIFERHVNPGHPPCGLRIREK